MKKVAVNIEQFIKAMKKNEEIYLIARLYDWYYGGSGIPNVVYGEQIIKYKEKVERIEEYE